MNKFVFLSKEFYKRHEEQQHTEIEQKQDRPYIQVCVEVDGIKYAIPMRSHIKLYVQLVCETPPPPRGTSPFRGGS